MNAKADTALPCLLYSREQIKQMTGWTSAKLWARVTSGKFPKPVPFDPNSWRVAEVDALLKGETNAESEEAFTICWDAINAELAKIKARASEANRQARAREKVEKARAAGPPPATSDVFVGIDAREERHALARKSQEPQEQ